MKKTRLFLLLLMTVLAVTLLCACDRGGGDETTTTVKRTTAATTSNKWSDKDFGGTSIRLQLSEYTDAEFSSGGKKYMQGPDSTSSDRVQNLVYTRNDNAKNDLNVDVSYYYINKGWSLASAAIAETENGGSDCPDMYCDMIYDMMIATLNGCFRNLYTMTEDKGYSFDFSDENGYLTEFMQGLTMSNDKMYLLGSQYYIDIIRAMLVMPVNLDMFESKYGDVDQFYQDIINGDWTWDYLMDVSKRVFNDRLGDNSTMDDIIGFAAETSGGMSASGIVYSTDLSIMNVEVQPDGSYSYSYKSDSPELIKIFTKIAEVFSTNGVVACTETGNSESQVGYIRDKFAEGTLVFGGCIMMGNIEAETYQSMDQAFGLIPIPKISREYDYNTLIHNVGKCGAISIHTQQPAAISAYLQYCSENSADIVNEYYNYAMKYKYTSDAGTAEMLDMIYNNIVSIREKAMEDIVGAQGNSEANANKWHGLLMGGDTRDYKSNADQIGTIYTTATSIKSAVLSSLMEKWKTLP